MKTWGWLGALVVTLLLTWPGAAVAAGTGASIDHSELDGSTLKLLVSVPGSTPVDLGSVGVTIDGAPAQATAEQASKTGDIARTTILAIDTSKSMAGARITEAKKAADAYLAQVPANVKVGIVTFDSTVRTRLAPTLDRATARQVVSGLTLALQTHLYNGVTGAVKALGTTGARQILLLSDGKDTTHAPISGPISTLKASGVKLDVVSLQKSDSGNAALNQLAQATGGRLISALDPKALSAAFASEADVLARQVLVTATVPKSQKSSDANVQVTLTAGGTSYTDTAFLTVLSKTGTPTTPAVPDSKPLPAAAGFTIPSQVMIGAVAAIGVGLLGIIFTLFRRPASAGGPASLEEQIGIYGTHGKRTGRRGQTGQQGGNASIASQARQAAENMLANNRGLEARLAKMLEGAGVALKPSEWLLLHALIVTAATAVGVLLLATSPVLIVVFLAGGVLVPWFYLIFKKARRLSAFNGGLADTLQLMSGSLSAGLSLAQSLDTIVREGTEPIAGEFRRVIVETRLGVPLEDALEGVAGRMQSQDFQWVVMAIRIQREVGGNLAELLLTVAATLREREYLRRHVKALSAEGRLSSWILGGLPPVFLLYLTVSKPEYVGVLYTSAIGWVMLGVMALMLTVGIVWMLKVAKVDI